MADPLKIIKKAPTDLVAGATNLKVVGSVIVGVVLGVGITGLAMKYFKDKQIVKDVQTGLNG